MPAARVASPVVFGLDDVVDEHDRWPACEMSRGMVLYQAAMSSPLLLSRPRRRGSW